MGYEIRALSEALGAEVVGLDLADDVSAADFSRLHRAHLDHLVLVFRDQTLTPQQQIDFSRRFGPLDAHPSQDDAHLPGFPEILLISTRTENGRDIGIRNAGPQWHSDLAYRTEPSLGSMLYALELPDSGGDTRFANMYRACEELPPRLRDAVEGRFALFKSTRNPSLVARHPVLRTHPETGRKSVFVNPQLTAQIDGLPAEESESLLQEIYAHCAQPQFIYRHKWQPGDLVFWDNRCVQHIADHTRLHDPGYIRHMHRTTIKGDAPY